MGRHTQKKNEREVFAKRSCVDLEHGDMGRAPWCNNYTYHTLALQAVCMAVD
jgi:hypothetical protein